MKNIALILLVLAMSFPALGQTAEQASPLDQAIEQQVRNQTNPSDANASQPRIVPDASDSRIVHMNGRTYQLRKKERNPGQGQFDTHTYVNPNDTITVNLSRANFDMKRKNNPSTDIPAGFTVTSREQLADTPTHQSQIVACEKKNPDGSCEYIVKKTDKKMQYVQDKDGISKGEITKGTVTIRQTQAAGTNMDSLRVGTYQAVKNTNIQQVFGPNVNRGGPNDIYGPESYSR